MPAPTLMPAASARRPALLSIAAGALALAVAAPAAAAVTVTLTAPTGGTYAINKPIQLTAEAGNSSEGPGVAQVEFFVDGRSTGVDTTAPYEAPWTSTQAGWHAVEAVATDTQGGVVNSETVQFSTAAVELYFSPRAVQVPVGASVPITATLNLPTSAPTRAISPMAVVANSAGVPAISRVEFLSGATKVAESTTSSRDEGGSLHVEATWAAPPAGRHELTARVTDADGTVWTAPATMLVDVTDAKLQIVAASNPLVVKPGVSFSVQVQLSSSVPVGDASESRVSASAAGYPVPGAQLEWVINQTGFPTGEVRAKRVANIAPSAICSEPDQPSSGLVTTDAQGSATITVLPLCDGERTLWVRPVATPNLVASLPVRGETATATRLRALLDGAPYVVAEAGTPATLRVQAVDAAGAPVAGAITDWTLSSADAGSVSPSVTAGSDGIAEGRITLAGARGTTARVCIRGQADSCLNVEVRTTAELIARPVREIVAPIAQHAIETSRTQLGLLRSRMGQLRNEQGHGFCDGASVQVQGLSMPLCAGGGGDDREGSRLGSFILGNATLGKRDADGRWSGYELLTRGLTGGVDYRFSPQWVGGAALGIARGSVDVGNTNTQDSSGYSGSLFGQWMPSNGLFATGVLSIGRNSFDIERRGSDQSLLASETDSRQTAMQLELGYSFGAQALKLTPYARYELIDVDVDGLSERGGIEAVAIDAYSVRNSAVSAGVSADYALSSRAGVWIPSLSVEFHNESRNLDVVHASLVNGSYGRTAVAMPEEDNRYGSVGFNLQWLTGGAGQPISSFIGYGMVFGRDNVESKSFTLGVKLPF